MNYAFRIIGLLWQTAVQTNAQRTLKIVRLNKIIIAPLNPHAAGYSVGISCESIQPAVVMLSWWRHQMKKFRVTGLLCGEITRHRWISRTKASDAELWCFLRFALEWTVEYTVVRLVIWETPLHLLWRHCNVLGTTTVHDQLSPEHKLNQIFWVSVLISNCMHIPQGNVINSSRI